jgi:ribosome-binding factor A
MTQRTEKIDELLRQEIGQALEREVTDPGIGFVTVTNVETAPDLSRARVWVSVIGTDEQRKETLAALRRAMPFIRHGLGSKIRLRRIPELDVRLDDSVERGTRVLQIINELEAGRPGRDPGAGESLPTPVPRLPHEGRLRSTSLPADAIGPSAPSPKARRRSGTRTGEHRSGRGKAARRPDRKGKPDSPEAAVSEASADERVDLSATPPPCPTKSSRGCGRRRRVLTICHENPEADALGSALAVACSSRRVGEWPLPVCADPMPAMYAFLPAWTASAASPTPRRLRPARGRRLRRTGADRARARHAPRPFERVPILDIDHHISNPRFGAVDWVDAASSATCEMVTLLAWRMGVRSRPATGCWPRPWPGGVVMDTGNFQHPNVTPRTLVVAAALREAGAPFSEIARRLYRSKPNTQLLLFGRVLARMESDLDGRLVWSTLELADLDGEGAGPPSPRGSSICWPSRKLRGRDPVQGSGGNGSTRISIGRGTAAWTRPS